MNNVDVTEVPECNKRNRRPLPPIHSRDWMSAAETALEIGCSIANVHRLRRGLIHDLPVLPSVSVGTRKFVFRKASVRRWQEQNENRAAV